MSGLQPSAVSPQPGTALESLRRNYPEYLIEAWALGMFMVSAGVFSVLLEYPGSRAHQVLPDPTLRRVLIGIAMGLTAIALIYSPWGKRSGAHMNPAITLTFLRLGKVKQWDAVFYVLAQCIGGLIGVLLVLWVLGDAFSAPPVSYAATLPGAAGVGAAFAAEVVISAGMMLMVLLTARSPRFAPFTGVFAGVLVATYIGIEAPYSGMSMNPARSFASAAPGMSWQHFWVYLTAPLLGMLLAGEAAPLFKRAGRTTPCAKLVHPENVRCIHCGHEPEPTLEAAPSATARSATS